MKTTRPKIWLIRVETRSKSGRSTTKGDDYMTCLGGLGMDTPPWSLLLTINSLTSRGARYWFTKRGWNQYGKRCVQHLQKSGVKLVVKTVEASPSKVAKIDAFQVLYPVPPSSKTAGGHLRKPSRGTKLHMERVTKSGVRSRLRFF